MAQLGFNVVRLGIIWKGLEPGTDPINDPAICTPGAPRTPGPDQFNAKVFGAYMDRLETTVALLARYGISSLIDMHQDVYNEVFGGEGAPQLGHVHRRNRPQASAACAELECQLLRTGRGSGVRSLLAE